MKNQQEINENLKNWKTKIHSRILKKMKIIEFQNENNKTY